MVIVGYINECVEDGIVSTKNKSFKRDEKNELVGDRNKSFENWVSGDEGEGITIEPPGTNNRLEVPRQVISETSYIHIINPDH